MNIRKVIRALLSIPYTIYCNFKYLKFREAIRFPLLVSFDTCIIGQGRIVLDSNLPRFSVKIGFFDVDTVEYEKTKLILRRGSILKLSKYSQIGRGCKVYCAENARLEIGTNSTISASTSIRTYKFISIGEDCRISWQCQIMDNNMHFISYDNGCTPNPMREIRIGNNVWIASRVMIFSGSVIPNNSIIGGGAIVKGNKFAENSIISGNPAAFVKSFKKWE